MHALDRRSEAIERQALVSLHAHCPEATRRTLGLFLDPVGDAWAAGATHDASILLNRTLGLGTRAPVDADRIGAVVDRYAAHGVDRYFVHVYPHSLPDDDGEAWRTSYGLERVRGWMKFGRGDAPPPERETDLTIRRVDASGAQHFGRIVARAFGMTEAAAPLLAGLVHDARWHLFVSYDGDTPAGAGALLVDGDVGWLEWGATEPAFRRRGSQGAIMAARIRAARELGCTCLFTETGEAVPGDPQHSYSNIQRFGFEERVLRHNWAPPRPG